MIYQFRLYIAEKFLIWAHKIALSDEANGEQIKGAVIRYFKSTQIK